VACAADSSIALATKSGIDILDSIEIRYSHNLQQIIIFSHSK